MHDFLRRFGERQGDAPAQFGNVRSGLIVGLVSLSVQNHSISY